MRSLLSFLLIYILIKLFLIGMGIGIGFLLHWLIPAVEIGIGILIGIIATGMAIHFFARLTALSDTYDPLDIVAGPEVRTLDAIESMRSRRSRKRKRL